jgi:hypothetical protein
MVLEKTIGAYRHLNKPEMALPLPKIQTSKGVPDW